MPNRRSPSRARRWTLRIVVALAVALAVLALESRRRMVRLAETQPPAGTMIWVDGVRLHYERAGHGPAVLLLHGCPGSTWDFKVAPPGETSVFDDLSRDHLVLALDRPGNGWSGRYAGRPTTLPAQARLVAHFLDAQGLGRVTLVGHSYGGSLAVATALEAPEHVDAVVSVGGVFYPDGFWDTDPLNTIMTAPVVGPVFRWSLSPVLIGPLGAPATVEAFAPQQPMPAYIEHAWPFIQRPPELLQMATELETLGAEVDALRPRYPTLAMPVVTIAGAAEMPEIVASARRLAEAVPDGRAVILDGMGHMIPQVRPATVAAEVRSVTPAE